MKIAVVSNCQGEGIAACLNDINPDIRADYIIISDLWSGSRDLNKILTEYDVILAQSMIAEHVTPQHQPKVRYFPNITFPAFHPDITYLRGKEKNGDMGAIHTHMAHYNSSLIVYGYIRGMSVDEIVGLFNEDTFRKLGYLDRWDMSKRMLLEEGEKIGFTLNSYVDKWIKLGCFMYSFNHPTMSVAADIAINLALGLGINIQNKNSFRYLNDPLKTMPVWPIYPAIAKRYGLDGDYAFTRYSPHGTMQLRQYVESCVGHYDNYELSSIEPLNFNIEDFDKALKCYSSQTSLANESLRKTKKPPSGNSSNPYKNLPEVQFWKKSVAEVYISELDPVYLPRFTITQKDKIATAGSCFAQHIARTLSKSGFNYFVSEQAPEILTSDEAHAKNYGVFSARYGNIYTVRQFTQLFKRVSGQFLPVDNFWLRSDGRYVDPFRPQIEPNGYESVVELESSRQTHFEAVVKIFKETDVFVFTLGLTEGWRSKIDGAVFPLAPGVAGGEMNPDCYEFVNFTVQEVISDMNEALALLREINNDCKVILTVSPVPLIATYEPQHALVATTYSKSVLRVAADEIKRAHDFVDYFPSFEIITGSFNKGAYFEEDLRSVTSEGVDHVMHLFMKHYTDGTQTGNDESAFIPQMKNVFGVVCDEEAIAKF